MVVAPFQMTDLYLRFKKLNSVSKMWLYTFYGLKMFFFCLFCYPFHHILYSNTPDPCTVYLYALLLSPPVQWRSFGYFVFFYFLGLYIFWF